MLQPAGNLWILAACSATIDTILSVHGMERHPPKDSRAAGPCRRRKTEVGFLGQGCLRIGAAGYELADGLESGALDGPAQEGHPERATLLL